ncbi:MAG: BlaI/MecI/CopY family transcriptional regulator [Chloroflexi bacterium]|nr:BlaI/MecI/CopY family transcriptional regulator [Chloroflexota bacterium]
MKDAVEPSVFRANRTGLRALLGDLEAETMNIIWERVRDPGITVREVHEILRQRRPIAYTTVMTTMVRLEKKTLLKSRKMNPAYVYYPAMGKAEFTSKFVGRILDQLLESYSGAAISHFAELAEPESREAVQRLLLDIVERRKKPWDNQTGNSAMICEAGPTNDDSEASQ